MKQKMKLGPRTKPVLADAGPLEAPARHARRPVPLGRGAPLERAMIPEYERAVAAAGRRGLTAGNLAEAVAIASLPDQVRGYEHIKLPRAAAYRAELATRLAAFR